MRGLRTLSFAPPDPGSARPRRLCVRASARGSRHSGTGARPAWGGSAAPRPPPGGQGSPRACSAPAARTSAPGRSERRGRDGAGPPRRPRPAPQPGHSGAPGGHGGGRAARAAAATATRAPAPAGTVRSRCSARSRRSHPGTPALNSCWLKPRHFPGTPDPGRDTHTHTHTHKTCGVGSVSSQKNHSPSLRAPTPPYTPGPVILNNCPRGESH